MYIGIIFPFLETYPATSIQNHQACTRKCFPTLECLSSLGLCFVGEIYGLQLMQCQNRLGLQTFQEGKTPFPHPPSWSPLIVVDLYLCYLSRYIMFTWLTFGVIYFGTPLFLAPSTVCSPVLLQQFFSPGSPDRMVPVAAAGVVSGGSNIWGHHQRLEVFGSFSEGLLDS